jgi:mono/diheme cytochrome c family protein
MSTRQWRHLAVALVVIAALWSALPVSVATQSPAPAAASAATRGEAWFYQRCSLCHMGRIVKDDKFEPMAPRLDGVLKNATPDSVRHRERRHSRQRQVR